MSAPGCLTVLVLGMATPSHPAVADNGPQVAVVSPVTVERRILPETTPSGTVVLRGSRPVEPEAVKLPSQPILAGSALPGAPFRPEGWDPYYDTAGINRSYDTSGVDLRSDRLYDTSGFDRGFDRSGLGR
jgi:hypothetical protein